MMGILEKIPVQATNQQIYNRLQPEVTCCTLSFRVNLVGALSVYSTLQSIRGDELRK
jgi:hypothetical protein